VLFKEIIRWRRWKTFFHFYCHDIYIKQKKNKKKKRKFKKDLQPGFEPGSHGWEAWALTVTRKVLLTKHLFSSYFYYILDFQFSTKMEKCVYLFSIWSLSDRQTIDYCPEPHFAFPDKTIIRFELPPYLSGGHPAEKLDQAAFWRSLYLGP